MDSIENEWMGVYWMLCIFRTGTAGVFQMFFIGGNGWKWVYMRSKNKLPCSLFLNKMGENILLNSLSPLSSLTLQSTTPG